MNPVILAQRIESLEKKAEQGAPELKAELESLRAIAQGISNKNIPVEDLNRISAPSFEAVLEELLDRKEVELVLELTRLKLDKEKRKLLNKARHRLKSRGVEIPEEVAGQKVTFPSRILKEWAMASPVMLLTGEQLLYYFASGTMGTNFLISHLHPEQGIVEAKIFHLNESQARKIVSNFKVGKEIKISAVEIPREHFLQRVEGAKGKSGNSQPRTEVASFLEKFQIRGSEAKDSEPPVFKLVDREKVESNPALIHKTDLLLEHLFFSTWAFDPETLTDCRRELDQARHSPIQLSEGQIRGRMQAIFEKHTEIGLSKNQERIKSSLLENAYLLALTGETELAEAALKLTLSLEDKNLSRDFFKKILLRSFPETEKVLGKKSDGIIIPGR